LGEVVVALGLMSLVSLTVVGLFSYLAVASQTRSERAAAELLADTLMESAACEGPPGWGVSQANLFIEVPVLLETGDARAKEQMVYQVIPVALDPDPDEPPPDPLPLGTLYKLTVRVSWVEPPGPNNVERGQGFIERARTVYVENS
jgi:hypothetical protein